MFPLAGIFDLDPTVVRLLWVLALIFSGGAVLLIYLALALIVTEEGYLPPNGRRPGNSWSPSRPGSPGF